MGRSTETNQAASTRRPASGAALPSGVGARRRWVRGFVIVVPAIVFVALLAVGVARRGTALEAGDEAPDFSAPLLAGDGRLALSQLEGRPVLLNFWASWCEPCRDEAPMLRRAYRIYGDRVVFVGIDVRDSRSDALAFAARHGLRYPLVRDDGRVLADYGLTGQPESFFIDSEGAIVEHVPGPLFEQDLIALLDILVARDA